jgi:hypothetical protein
MIGGGQTTDRINHSPNFFHFKNQQSSLDNHQSDLKKRGPVAYALMAGLVLPSGPNTKQPGAGVRREACGLRCEGTAK